MADGFADLAEQVQAGAQVELVFIGPADQRLALHQFQCEPRAAVFIQAVVDQAGDVGVGQRSKDAALLQEALRLQAAVPAPVQALEGGALFGVTVIAARGVHRAHATTANHCFQKPMP